MEKLSDFDEEQQIDFDEQLPDSGPRDSIAISETVEPIDLNELITELFVIPDTDPIQYNVK